MTLTVHRDVDVELLKILEEDDAISVFLSDAEEKGPLEVCTEVGFTRALRKQQRHQTAELSTAQSSLYYFNRVSKRRHFVCP